jgi:hypothetical protein
MMRDALAILVLPGPTPALAWELEQIFSDKLESKLFILTPPQRHPTAEMQPPPLHRVRDIVVGWLLEHAVPGYKQATCAEICTDVVTAKLSDLGVRDVPRPLPPGAVLGFNSDRSATLIAAGCRSAESFVAPMAARLGLEAPPIRDHDVDEDLSEGTGPSFDALFDRWWGKLVVSFVLCASALWLYDVLSDWHMGERSGPSRVKAFVGLLYLVGGRFGATALLAAMGLASFAWGIHQRVLTQRSR